jgi:uncharacterized protein YkwD
MVLAGRGGGRAGTTRRARHRAPNEEHLLRKIAAAILAVPVLAALYVPVLFRRGVAIRAGLAAGAGLVILVAAVGALPRPASALPPVTAGPIAAQRFGPDVQSREALDGAVAFEFAGAMDQPSVADALSVDPETPVTLAWLNGGRTLLVSARDGWAPETYYTITIRPAARDAAGVTLPDPIRTAFYTRGPTGARIVATELVSGGRVAPDAAFIVAFERPVDAAAARAAFRIDPATAGELQAGKEVGPTEQLTFIPRDGLTSGTRYTISIAGPLRDTDGALVDNIPPLVVETAVAPAVVRFRPRSGTEEVPRGADISVRFTRPMDRAATQRAFVVSVKGTPLLGDYQWAEDDTVVVFSPRDPLPWGTDVVMSVTADATGADGTPIESPVTADFKTVPRPVATPPAAPVPTPAPSATPNAAPPKPTPTPTPGPTPTPTPKPTPTPSSGGGSTGGGPWASAERYYLGLLNCTRGGGIVTASGACSSPGGSGVAPLVLDEGISDRVSRPYAKRLATTSVCSHFDGGNPGDRLRAAGYTSYRWAENLGCESASSAIASALGTQLYFQSERSWSPPGGHWVNMMNPAYDRVGIGVWVAGGQIRIVIDFYRP